MEEVAALTPEDAQRLLDKAEPLSAAETHKLLRFFKKANEEVLGKMRQLKSEIGRVSRR